MPTPTHNVLLAFVLPPAALDAADRLVTALMTLVHAVADIGLATTKTSTFPAHTVFIRLSDLILTLIRIINFGIRAPREPKIAPPRIHPAPAAQPIRLASLPRRPGWLLAALPDIAPDVAADLGLLLADPALAALLAAAPSLHRRLGPLLRALGLAAPPPVAPPNPPPFTAPPPHPARPSQPPPPSCRVKTD